MSRICCDYEKCIGCLACVVSCMDRHYPADAADAVSHRSYEKVNLASGLRLFHTYSCRHCENADCIAVCPVGAISKTGSGAVVTDREKCVGCRACQRACKYHIPRYDAQGKMVKCDLCGVEKPACAAVCPLGALTLCAENTADEKE